MHAGVCADCERPVQTYDGPTSPKNFDYLVKEVASALIDIGNGASYTEAAERVRAQAWGAKRKWHRGSNTVVDGGLVAEWLQQFGPVVAAEHQETAWPKTLVLDSTEFWHKDSWTGVRQQLFCVLFAYGYPGDGTKPRMWKIAAAPRDTAAAWAEFLDALPGVPEVVVCDDDKAIAGGVRQKWGGAVRLHLCEHHLYMRARGAMKEDGIEGDHPIHALLNDAFRGPGQWEAFEAVAHALAAPHLVKWLDDKTPRLAEQLAHRGETTVYSNGAIEAPIQTVREAIERRAWCFRNRQRMDLLLELMRLRLNKVHSVEAYMAAIRRHIEETDGHPANARRQWDPKGVSSLRA